MVSAPNSRSFADLAAPEFRGRHSKPGAAGFECTDEKKPAHVQAFFVLAEQAGFEPAVGY
ncbi:hypothetical protein B9Z51_06360 [Limnohabitans sp. T6-5]|nr:hypothetical protein B9Z51_06360 [Limnohabitans sp. T6-5]